jgi:hypothetical protein
LHILIAGQKNGWRKASPGWTEGKAGAKHLQKVDDKPCLRRMQGLFCK